MLEPVGKRKSLEKTTIVISGRLVTASRLREQNSQYHYEAVSGNKFVDQVKVGFFEGDPSWMHFE